MPYSAEPLLAQETASPKASVMPSTSAVIFSCASLLRARFLSRMSVNEDGISVAASRAALLLVLGSLMRWPFCSDGRRKWEARRRPPLPAAGSSPRDETPYATAGAAAGLNADSKRNPLCGARMRARLLHPRVAREPAVVRVADRAIG